MVFRAIALIALSGLIACQEPAPPGDPDVPVHVNLVAVDEHDVPVVVLEEKDGSRWLPIWIGHSEARSIALEIGDRPSARPNSHDLAEQLIQDLQGELVRVVVTDLRDGTYFAILTLRTDGKTLQIDARPSDAIAIALRADVPIFVRSSLLESARPHNGDPFAEQRI